MNIKKHLCEDEATFAFTITNVGEVCVTVKFLNVTQQHNLVCFDCYNMTFKHWTKANCEESEFISDLKDIAEAIDKLYKLRIELTITEITKILVEKHISKFGRIIDTDLYTLAAEFQLVFDAISKAEGGRTLNENGKKRFFSIVLECVKQNYGNKFYITHYNNEPYARPKLINYQKIK